MSRTSISRLGKTMFALSIFAFLFVAFQFVFSPRGYRVERNNWQDVVPGSAQMVRRGAEYVWVVRYLETESSSFNALTKFVLAGTSECDPDIFKACEFSGTAGEGIVIRYLEKRPIGLPQDALWFNGFTDPTTGAFYDRFGRMYRLEIDFEEPEAKGLKTLLRVSLED